MYVYLLRSVERPDKVYVGATRDLRKRLEEHNQGRSHHTSRFRPWRLEVSIWFADETKAWAFERYLKRGSGHAFARRHFQDEARCQPKAPPSHRRGHLTSPLLSSPLRSTAAGPGVL